MKTILKSSQRPNLIQNAYLSHSQDEIWKDDSQLNCVFDQYTSIYGFPKFVVLLIDSILGVNVYIIMIVFIVILIVILYQNY